jgi:hypothetical protein
VAAVAVGIEVPVVTVTVAAVAVIVAEIAVDVAEIAEAAVVAAAVVASVHRGRATPSDEVQAHHP